MLIRLFFSSLQLLVLLLNQECITIVYYRFAWNQLCKSITLCVVGVVRARQAFIESRTTTTTTTIKLQTIYLFRWKQNKQRIIWTLMGRRHDTSYNNATKKIERERKKERAKATTTTKNSKNIMKSINYKLSMIFFVHTHTHTRARAHSKTPDKSTQNENQLIPPKHTQTHICIHCEIECAWWLFCIWKQTKNK